MRGHRPRSLRDLDTVDVLIVEDDDRADDVATDDMRTLLHELALEAMAWRATWPGESRPVLDDAEDGTGAARPGWARRMARRYRRRAVTCAVLAVAVAATTAVVDARQTAARAAALAATPAVLAGAPSAPTEVWRVPGRVVGARSDRLLVVDDASLRGVDPATGAHLWTASAAAGRAAASGDCFPVDEALRPDREPVEDGGGPPGLVACVGAPPAGTAQGPAAPADVVVVDSSTGRTRHTVTADGALLLAEPVGRDLLVAAARADGRVRVTRWDLASGAPRWDSASPGPVLTDGAAGAAERRPDSLTVGAFAVDLTTGEALDAQSESRKPYPYEEHEIPGGGSATWSWHGKGSSGRGTVSGGTAGRTSMLPGPPVRPSVTDGSDAHVLVVRVPRGDRLRGLDLRTGRMRWTLPYPGASTVRATALVDGVMLLDDGATVTALDVRTGTDRWRAAVDADAVDAAALTDGEVVLLPVRAGGGAPQLVARRIADGAVAWRSDLPAGTVALTVVDHRLVAATCDEVIGLG